jgi:hypothetical protein
MAGDLPRVQALHRHCIRLRNRERRSQHGDTARGDPSPRADDVTRRPLNPKVAGSKPARPTRKGLTATAPAVVARAGGQRTGQHSQCGGARALASRSLTLLLAADAAARLISVRPHVADAASKTLQPDSPARLRRSPTLTKGARGESLHTRAPSLLSLGVSHPASPTPSGQRKSWKGLPRAPADDRCSRSSWRRPIGTVRTSASSVVD